MEIKQRLIIREASALFAEQGYNDTSVDQIAKRAGMAKASFYKYFSKKEDILIASSVLFIEDLDASFQHLSNMEDLSQKERMINCTKVTLECMMRNQVHMLLFTSQELSVVERENITKSEIDIECGVDSFIHNGLLDIYGKDIEPFVSDLSFILRGIVIEYLRDFARYTGSFDSTQLATFVEQTTSMLVTGFRALGETYSPMLQSGQKDVGGPSNPFIMRILLREKMNSLENLLGHMPEKETFTSEAKQVMQDLKKELAQPKPRLGVIHAYSQFLGASEHLKTDADSLYALLRENGA
ncbi:TetR/AcrR family transcriptional regulator [Aureibacillus halotolerans]|uniref:TetR family transcriptional regulator n=1 Tax=Aureibacillus halotolerans TaxID=1508390 RepID=A0A4R6TTE2_9BACI|nr:TetR/AcrR family transcriptional regulator [Aureibacillus halotolerans]TDQ36561.1 TetR family transcriptional regulator [Aureibacillus halotolerans]